ncbi:MAG TPA: Crp/Fnr family transcriptional regulator, partial [Porphyromonadaceae bacterium]|nr:Crp/Fnr family transcriptional regulator [Porphyromonadaceae bacterium]
MAKKSNDIIDISSSLSEIWRILTEDQRELVRESAEIVHYKKGQMIYVEEEQPSNLICLLKGKVKIFKTGVGGRTQIIRMIRPVQYFGYRAYFARESYVTSASAFENSTVCLIPMELIEDFVRKDGNLAMFFIGHLSVDLGIADQRAVNLTQ